MRKVCVRQSYWLNTKTMRLLIGRVALSLFVLLMVLIMFEINTKTINRVK